MPFYDETRIPITNDFQFVGYLEYGVRGGVGKPWQHASKIVRARVYSKRAPNLLPNSFVDISGRKLTVGRKWKVAVPFWQPLIGQLEYNRKMQGQRRYFGVPAWRKA